MSEKRDAQREVTRIALSGIAGFGFALAGSGAIREHGVIDRPTEDVDLFTTTRDPVEFVRAVERVSKDLRERGYEVGEVRRATWFARLRVRAADGTRLEVDLGVDWRRSAPVVLGVGPVLSVEDAVGSKVSALYSRGEPRDYLDVDAIRRWGQFTDEELVNAVTERDPGFETGMFAQQLEAVGFTVKQDVREYAQIEADALAGAFDCFLLSRATVLDSGDPVAYMVSDFSSTGSFSLSLLADDAVDAALAKAAGIEAGEERQDAIMAAEEFILATGAAVPLLHERVLQGEAAGLAGAERDPRERALITSATVVA